MPVSDYLQQVQNLGATITDIGERRRLENEKRAAAEELAKGMALALSPDYAPVTTKTEQNLNVPVFDSSKIKGAIQPPPPSPQDQMNQILGAANIPRYDVPDTTPKFTPPPITTGTDTTVTPGKRIDKQAKVIQAMETSTYPESFYQGFTAAQVQKDSALKNFKDSGYSEDLPPSLFSEEERKRLDIEIGQPRREALYQEVERKRAQLGSAKAKEIQDNLDAAKHTVTPEEAAFVNDASLTSTIMSEGKWRIMRETFAKIKAQGQMKADLGITQKGLKPYRGFPDIFYDAKSNLFTHDTDGNVIPMKKSLKDGLTVLDGLISSAAKLKHAQSLETPTMITFKGALDSIPDTYAKLQELHDKVFNLSDAQRADLNKGWRELIATPNGGLSSATLTKWTQKFKNEISDPTVASLLSQTLAAAERTAVIYQQGKGALTDAKLRMALDLLDPSLQPLAYNASLDTHKNAMEDIRNKTFGALTSPQAAPSPGHVEYRTLVNKSTGAKKQQISSDGGLTWQDVQ